MQLSSLTTTLVLFAATASAQRLDKPPLQQDLENLQQGFADNLHPASFTQNPYAAGFIPSDCKDIAQNENQNPADFTVVDVQFDDCPTPWTFCHHNAAPAPLSDFISTFARLPVSTRQFCRHIISIPSANGYAYNSNGNIVFFGPTLTNTNVFLHESAHSLDLLNAYADKPLSSSQKWLGEYDQDSAVPDPYAQTNQVENVAQNTVITSYERNVPGGFFGLQPEAGKIFHQFATVDTEQREAGNLLIPGGQCGSRLEQSQPVPVGAGVGASAKFVASETPDVGLKGGVKKIEAKVFDTKEGCKAAFGVY